PQSTPPPFARCVYAFRAGLCQDLASFLCLLISFGKGNYYRVPFSDRIFVKEKLVVRQAISDALLQRFASFGATHGSSDTKDCRPQQSRCDYGSDTWDKETGSSRSQRRSAGNADSTSHGRAQGLTDAWLFRLRCCSRIQLRFRAAGVQKIDPV